MRKYMILGLSMLCALSIGANAQMTDSQVVEYVKTAMASGKSENQVGRELLAKGVTPAQAERIKKQYENSGVTSVTEQGISRGAINRKNTSTSLYDGMAPLSAVANASVIDNATDSHAVKASNIYGHDIFNGRTLTFEPNENVATPENYKLGPGDEILVDIWGYNEASINSTITPEGKIFINQIGPVQLSGLTIKEASEKIRKVLVSKYSGIGGDQPNSSVSVTLGRVRTIQINVMGEVSTPGTFRLSSFSTVFHAIYRAGGVKDTGSLRDIKVVRGGEAIASVDVYGYLFEGKSDSDISLQEGDIVLVPPYLELVQIEGGVKRPMYYELKDKETLSQLIDYAGGFTGDAYRNDLLIVRQTGQEKQVFTVKQDKFSSFQMADGDAVSIGSALETFANKVEVRGFVFRPGMYQLGGDIATVSQLVEMAGGPKEDAFLQRAVLMREKDDLSLETVSVDLGAVLSGAASDVLLRKNDVLVISSKHELEDRGTMTINGSVAEPSIFPFAENTTIKDLIVRAGGLLPQASHSRVDVVRLVNDPDSTSPSDTLSMTYSFSIEDGLAIDGGDQFYLKPYDVVSVRMSPGFQPQKFVNVSGKVCFPGRYVLIQEGERLSDVIARAGGITSQAYSQGARLVRHTDENTAYVNGAIRDNLGRNTGRDTISVNKLELDSTYSVAINLEKALLHVGSADDVILKDGDEIVVPEFSNTVRIMGEVMFPNAVAFDPSKRLSYYIDAAGGYSDNAKRSRVYIVYMNGMAHKGSATSSKIEPGSVIIVPSKKERKAMSTSELLAIASSAASLTTMTATLFNIFK